MTWLYISYIVFYMSLTEEEINKAIEIAKNAKQNAFAFKSGHTIGASVISIDGKIYGGCNTEHDISGLGVCAKRSAIDHAVINGQYEYKGLVTLDDEETFPCGACLQYLELFSQINNENITVIVAKEDGSYSLHSLHELLPDGYTAQHEETLDAIRKYRNKETLPIQDTL